MVIRTQMVGNTRSDKSVGVRNDQKLYVEGVYEMVK